MSKGSRKMIRIMAKRIADNPLAARPGDAERLARAILMLLDKRDDDE